jgi:hypothetical protein
MAQQPFMGQDLMITLRETISSRILWMSDQPDAEIFTLQHSTPTRERYPCPQ